MIQAEACLALSERLKHEAQRQSRAGRRMCAADLRYASSLLRKFASVLVAEESRSEPDPVRRRELEHESARLWCGSAHR
jgi:hypothetical protein